MLSSLLGLYLIFTLLLDFRDSYCFRDGKLCVRLPRLELGTSTLSVLRSNQLSYNR